MHLVRVRQHLPQRRVQQGCQFDAFSRQALEEWRRVPNHGIEVQRFRTDHLFPAERQQLGGETGSMLARLQDLLRIPAQRIPNTQSLDQERAVTVHDREKVIELVRHAAG